MGILLLVFGGLTLIIAGFGIAALYHARKFSYPGDAAKLASLLYLITFGLIFIGTLVYLGSNSGNVTL